MSVAAGETLQPAPVGLSEEERRQHNQAEMVRLYPDSPVHVARFQAIQPPESRIFIKIGGKLLSNPATRDWIANSAVVMQDNGLAPIFLHGGGEQIDREIEKTGRTSRKIDGVRITPQEDMPAVSRALTGVQEEFLESIRGFGGQAVGFSRLFEVNIQGPDNFAAKEVTGVDTLGVRAAQRAGKIAVVSCEGVSRGRPANVNGDMAGAALAVALRSEKYISLMEEGGIYEYPGGPRYNQLTPDEVEALIASGIIKGGMVIKSREGVGLTGQGVHDVVFTKDHMKELFTDEGEGTIIHRLVRDLAKRGQTL